MSSKTVHERMDRLGRKIAAASDDGISWHGWIRGGRKQKRELRELGVRGLMLYTLSDAHGGVYEQCLCDSPTMQLLLTDYPLFWPGTFTGCDVNGDQLPGERQKYWKM